MRLGPIDITLDVTRVVDTVITAVISVAKREDGVMCCSFVIFVKSSSFLQILVAFYCVLFSPPHNLVSSIKIWCVLVRSSGF